MLGGGAIKKRIAISLLGENKAHTFLLRRRRVENQPLLNIIQICK
jgi:hypothetical protein